MPLGCASLITRFIFAFAVTLIDLTIQSASVSAQGAKTSTGVIAYAGRDGNLWTVHANGSGHQRLTNDGGAGRRYHNPRWSPDGQTIAFDIDRPCCGAGSVIVPEDIGIYRDGNVRTLDAL